jgi:hypothetical protein
VTFEWADREAGTMFRKLVREGTVVESRAFRIVGERLDTSFSRANVLWQQARRTVTTTAKSLADVTTSLVRQAIPAKLPRAVSKNATRTSVKRSTKRVGKTAPVSASAKRGKRSAKRAVKGS